MRISSASPAVSKIDEPILSSVQPCRTPIEALSRSFLSLDFIATLHFTTSLCLLFFAASASPVCFNYTLTRLRSSTHYPGYANPYREIK
jgi:hypothetical protein